MASGLKAAAVVAAGLCMATTPLQARAFDQLPAPLAAAGSTSSPTMPMDPSCTVDNTAWWHIGGWTGRDWQSIQVTSNPCHLQVRAWILCHENVKGTTANFYRFGEPVTTAGDTLPPSVSTAHCDTPWFDSFSDGGHEVNVDGQGWVRYFDFRDGSDPRV